MDCESRTEGWESLADNSQKPRGKAFSPTAPFLLKKKKGGLLLIESHCLLPGPGPSATHNHYDSNFTGHF